MHKPGPPLSTPPPHKYRHQPELSLNMFFSGAALYESCQRSRSFSLPVPDTPGAGSGQI